MKKFVFCALLYALPLLAPVSRVFGQAKAAPAAYRDPAQYGQPFAGVPESQNATIYQVNMRGFSREGNFRGVLARLDSIKALGVNVVYLMPIFPIGKLKAVDSPFAVQNYLAVNPEFGSLDDLRALVDAAHARGLAVLLDWVGNHTSWDHPWIQQHPDWYVRDEAGNLKNPIPEWKDIVQLNFANPQLRQAMTQALRYWVFQANIDGYRFDYADGPTAEFFREALGSLKAIRTHKLLLLAEGDRKKHFFDVGFQLNYDFGFIKTLRHDILEHGQSVKLLDSLNAAVYRGAPPTARMLRYVSNHDLNAWEGTPQQLFGGPQGALASFVVAAYMHAVPMIYNGQEVGFAERLPFMGPRKAIAWTPNPALTAEYKQLIGLRNNSNALRNGKLTSYSTDDVCAFTKRAGKELVLVLVNLRATAQPYTVPAGIAGGTWRNAFTGQAAPLGASLTLPPYHYLVLRK